MTYATDEDSEQWRS